MTDSNSGPSPQKGGALLNKKIRVIELFSGIGATASAFSRLGLDFELWKTSDWCVDSVASYKAIHHSDDSTDYSANLTEDQIIRRLVNWQISSDGKNPMGIDKVGKKDGDWLRKTYNDFMASHNVGSILRAHAPDFEIANKDKYFYMMTYSWPCQALSNAGKREGMKKGSGTSSSLLWEVQRILQECGENLPDVLISENVLACHNKNNWPEFDEWLKFLDSIGYVSVWQDLNAKDYGVAQSRPRNHIVSILKNVSRETYKFPEPFPLTKCLKNYLEKNVPDDFYVESKKSRKLIEDLFARGQVEGGKRETKTVRLGNLYGDKFGKGYAGNVWDKEGICPTIMCVGRGGGRVPMMVDSKEYFPARIVGRCPDDPTSRDSGLPTKQMLEITENEKVMGCLTSVQKDNVVVEVPINTNPDGVARTIKAQYYRNSEANFVRTDGTAATGVATSDYRIRKLTPLECWRLMGFTDEEFEKAKSVSKTASLYNQAGNAIVVDVLAAVIKNVFEAI